MIGELVEHLAQVVVRDREAVHATETRRAGVPSRVDVALQVAGEDFGRVIGKSGQTIGAIRVLAAFAGRRQGLDVSVELVEETGPSKGGDEHDEAD